MGLTDQEKDLLDDLAQAMIIEAMLVRGDIDKTNAGYWLDFIHQFKHGKRYDSPRYTEHPELKWYYFMTEQGVTPTIAMKMAYHMGGKFACVEDGITWLSSVRDGDTDPRVREISWNQYAGGLNELRQMPGVSTVLSPS